jgi:membrane carboxypeptidase/penicillin-binding protein
MQMATAYPVVGNGGHRVHPYLITRITHRKDTILVEKQPPLLNQTITDYDRDRMDEVRRASQPGRQRDPRTRVAAVAAKRWFPSR